MKSGGWVVVRLQEDGRLREVDLAAFGGGPLPLQNSRDVVSPCMQPSTLVLEQGERKCSSYQSTAVKRNLGCKQIRR